MVRVRILGIRVIKFNSQGPALRILDLRVSIPKPQRPSCRVLGVRASCPRVPVSRSWVSGFQSPESQGLTVPQSRVSGFQGLRVLVSNLRVKDPGSQVLILDCAFTYIYIFTCYLSGPQFELRIVSFFHFVNITSRKKYELLSYKLSDISIYQIVKYVFKVLNKYTRLMGWMLKWMCTKLAIQTL